MVPARACTGESLAPRRCQSGQRSVNVGIVPGEYPYALSPVVLAFPVCILALQRAALTDRERWTVPKV